MYRKDVDGWSAALEKLLQGSAASCNWLIHYLGSENGYQHIRLVDKLRVLVCLIRIGLSAYQLVSVFGLSLYAF